MREPLPTPFATADDNTVRRALTWMLDAALLADDQRRCVDANDAAARLFGVDREELIARGLDDFSPSNVEAVWMELLQAGERVGVLPLVRPDGSRRVVEYKAHARVTRGLHLMVLRDIAERAEREAQVASFADHVPFVVTRFDRDRRHLYVNARITEYTGKRPAEIIGKTNEELGMPSELVARWNDAIDAAFAGKESEISFPWGSGGGERLYSCRLLPERSADGSIEAVLGISRDITDEVQLKAARDKLLQQVSSQRAQLSALVDQLPVPAIVYQPPDYRIEMINSAYRSLVRGRDIVGKTPREAFPDLAMDSTLGYLSEVSRLGETRLRREYVSRLPDQPGERVFNNTFQPLIDDAGQVVRIVATAIDVTDEVRTRKSITDFAERLRLILDEMPLGVVVRDARSGTVVLANRTSKEILGVDVTGTALDETRPVWNARYLDGRPLGPDDDAFRRAIVTGAGVPSRIVVLQQAGTGNERVLRSSAAHMRGDNEAPLVISVFEDITDEQRLLLEREQAVQFAEAFVGILGHDLRNPLNSVTMAAEVFEMKSSLSEKDLKKVRLIRSSAERMTRMVNQLLDLTRGRLGGGIPAERKRTDLVCVVTTVLSELASAHPEVNLRPDLPFEAWGEWDGDRLQQVVSNLVGNAIEHADLTRPVSVTLEHDGARAVLEVHNYGPPIPEALMPVLFDPYRRGPREPNARSKGLGLGLYIVQEIVKAHGGEVRVTSNVSEGTTFVVRLPVA